MPPTGLTISVQFYCKVAPRSTATGQCDSVCGDDVLCDSVVTGFLLCTQPDVAACKSTGCCSLCKFKAVRGRVVVEFVDLQQHPLKWVDRARHVDQHTVDTVRR